MTATATEGTVLRFIADELLHHSSRVRLRADQPLLEDGLLDSFALQKLVSFLEQKFYISLKDEDLVPENFATVSAIAKLVEDRLRR